MDIHQQQYTKLMSFIARMHERRHQLTEAAILKLASKVEYIEYKKNDKLQLEGQIAEWMYMIAGGVVREHCLRSDGVDVILGFHEAMTGTGSLHSYEEQVPCLYSLTAVTTVTAYRIRCCDFSYLLENNLDMSLWYAEELRQSCVKMQKHTIDTTCRTGEERLELLIKQRPNLLKVVPHYQLANYLNMTPVSFSRTKKNLLQEASCVS